MNNDKDVIFKTVLYVDEKIVAESDDLSLWQRTLSSIKSNISFGLSGTGKDNDLIVDMDDNNQNEDGALLEKFANDVEISLELVKDACSPSLEAPFIHLDMKTWENYKRKHFVNKRPLPDVVIVATILALWKKSADLGEVSQKEVLLVLKQLNIAATNPSRSYKNCEWLKYDNNKIVLMATKYSLAVKMFKDYCDSI